MRYTWEDVHYGADSTRANTEPGESMKHVMAILAIILKAFMNDCVTAGRTTEQVVKPVRRMPRVPPRCRFETRKRFTV